MMTQLHPGGFEGIHASTLSLLWSPVLSAIFLVPIARTGVLICYQNSDFADFFGGITT